MSPLPRLIKTGDYGAAQRIAERLRPALADPEVRPLTGAGGRIWLAVRRLWQGRFDDCAELLEEAQRIVEENSLGFFVPVILIARCYLLVARSELGALRELIDRLAAARDLPASWRAHCCIRSRARSPCCAATCPWPSGGRGPPPCSRSRPAPYRPRSSATQCALVALDATGQRAECQAVLERMHGLVAGVRGGFLRFHLALWEAHLLLQKGDDAFRTPLAQGLELGRREDYFHQLLWWPPMMSGLCAAALDAGRDRVRATAHHTTGLAPPADRAPEHWPGRSRSAPSAVSRSHATARRSRSAGKARRSRSS